jgi:hypothetical protein
MIKRQVYGRAGFELLRARVLPYGSSTALPDQLRNLHRKCGRAHSGVSTHMTLKIEQLPDRRSWRGNLARSRWSTFIRRLGGDGKSLTLIQPRQRVTLEIAPSSECGAAQAITSAAGLAELEQSYAMYAGAWMKASRHPWRKCKYFVECWRELRRRKVKPKVRKMLDSG